MSESPAVQAAQPVLNQNGRICLSFDVIDEPSITYSDAVHALSLECSPVLLPPPHWGHKSLSGYFIPQLSALQQLSSLKQTVPLTPKKEFSAAGSARRQKLRPKIEQLSTLRHASPIFLCILLCCPPVSFLLIMSELQRHLSYPARRQAWPPPF